MAMKPVSLVVETTRTCQGHINRPIYAAICRQKPSPTIFRVIALLREWPCVVQIFTEVYIQIIAYIC